MELIRNAGLPGILVVLLGLGGVVMLALTAAMVAGSKPRQALVFAGLMMAFGSAALLVGAAGRTSGRINTFMAVAHAKANQRERLIELGFEEANASIYLGAGFGLPLLLLGAAATALQLTRGGGQR
ncbi:MAG: hypothetical protein IT380_19950 [Myxococcales bacterium]|nr:hypothetical protein [Myxococcales bacterium]